MRGTKVGDEGLSHLRGLGNLRRLGLMDTRVTDAGLPHLSSLKSLEEICWLGTEVTEEGYDRFREALPNCKILTGH
jgi:hypothetical protein